MSRRFRVKQAPTVAECIHEVAIMVLFVAALTYLHSL